MLVLSRRDKDTIHIGDDIVVHIILPEGAPKIRVGIEAPDDVKIMRGELLDHQKNQE